MNLAVTVSFVAVGVDDDQAGDVFQSLRAKISRWWRYQNQKGLEFGPLVDVHAHANPAGSRHVHWLLHVPDGAVEPFKARVAAFLRRLTVPELKDALHFAPVYAAGMHGKYILKGIEEAYASYLHIEPVNEGWVTGRRTGTSRGISRTARKRAGWSRKARAKAA